MKKLFICAFVVVLSALCQAQTPQLDYFNEAKLIDQFVKAHTTAPITFTVTNQVPVPNDQTAFNNLLNTTATALGRQAADIKTEFLYLLFLRYDDNQADLKNVISTFPAQFNLIVANAAGAGDADLGTTGFNFNTLESNAIYALAKFAITRAKQELVEVYLNQWYNRLNNDDVIQPLLPNTLSVFNAFNQDNSVNLAAYGDKWKTAFNEDLQNMPVRFQDETYVDKVLARAGIAHGDEIGPVIVGGDSIIYQLYQKNHLVNILDQMATNDINDTKPAVFKKLVVLTSMLLSISGQMDIDKSTYSPVALSTLKGLSLDDWHMLMKLIYVRKYKELNYAIDAAALDSFVKTYVVSPNVNTFISLTTQTMTIASNYQKLIVIPVGQSTAKKLTFDDARQMLDLCFQLIDNVESYRQLFHPDAAQKLTYDTKIKPFFSYLSQVGQGIQTKQYGEVLDGTIGLINQIQKSSIANPVNPLAVPAGQAAVAVVPTGAVVNVIPNATVNGYQVVTVSSTTAITPVATGSLPATLQYLQIYGSFMLNVLNAKSDTAIENALNELIPQGDYKLKNAQAFTASLSAFPGAWLGAETVSVYKTDASGNANMTKAKITKTAFTPGIYLPIGVDLNWGHQASGSTAATPKYNSWGMFFQVLDLGAVLSYRISSDQSIANAPTISFKQILSPGFCITHHLTNSPVVFGAGINYSPDLRQISQGTATYGANSLRYGAFVAVDVTFFTAGGKRMKNN